MILIKLGGSIITNKEKALTPMKKKIDNIIKNLKYINEPYVVIHGGGSFGHYWSIKYNMHTKPDIYNVRGIALVKNSMIFLNKIILDSFLKNNINPYPFPASNFMEKDKPIIKKINEMKEILKLKLVPVSFGDLLWYERKKAYILSGDRIMTVLSKLLKPRLAIFVINVDGLYSDFKKKKIIHILKDEYPDIKKIHDATGGMKRKFEEAKKISKMNINVFFTNGNKPKRIRKAIETGRFEGTLFV